MNLGKDSLFSLEAFAIIVFSPQERRVESIWVIWFSTALHGITSKSVPTCSCNQTAPASFAECDNE